MAVMRCLLGSRVPPRPTPCLLQLGPQPDGVLLRPELRLLRGADAGLQLDLFPAQQSDGLCATPGMGQCEQDIPAHGMGGQSRMCWGRGIVSP